jgi:hypothetical protein
VPTPGELSPSPPPSPSPPSSRYQAYLLRLWREGPGAPWRAALEVPGGGDSFCFGTVGALFAFLRDQLADPDPDPDAGPDGPGRPWPRTPGRTGGNRS